MRSRTRPRRTDRNRHARCDARQGSLRKRSGYVRCRLAGDDYAVFKSPLRDFLAAVERAGWKDRVKPLQRGERHAFSLRAPAR